MANLVLTGSPGIRDHKDGNGLNNCRGNLRLASNAQNCRNKRPSGQSSKFKGVSRVSRSRTLWTARIWLGNFGTTLGSFNTQSAAAIAYDVAALTIFKEFAWLNTAHFPELTRVERGILCAMFRG